MKITKKLLAFAMAILMIVPLAFTACKDAEVASGADSFELEKEYAFTKEYFEANKMAVIENSVDADNLLGFDDSFFDFFKNEKLKKGMQADVEMDVDGVGMSLSVSTLAEPVKARVDVALEAPELPVDASVYFDGGKLSLASDLFIGETPVELKFDGLGVLLEKLAGSALGRMLQVPEAEEMKAAIDELGITDEYIANVKKAFNDYMAVYGDGDAVIDSFTGKINGIVEGTLGEVGEAAVNNYQGVEIEAYTLECAIDENDIINMVNTALDMYAESINGSNELMKTVLSFDEELLELYNTSEMLSEVESLRAEILSAFEYTDITGVETLYFGKADGKFFRSDVTMTITAEGEQIVLNGSEFVVDNGVIIEADVTIPDEEPLEIDGRITGESTEQMYTLAFDFDIKGSDDVVSADAGFVVDKQNNSYELKLTSVADGETASFGVNGSVQSSADSFSFTVDSVYENDEVTELPENRITIRVIDDIADHENAKDIFELDENEVYGIFARIAALSGGLEG